LLEATAALAAGYGRVLAWSHWHVWKSNCVCNYTQIGICVKKNNVCWYDEVFFAPAISIGGRANPVAIKQNGRSDSRSARWHE
jgi:hypothetical protein